MLWNMSHGLRFLGNEWSFLKVHSLGVISTCLYSTFLDVYKFDV